MAIVVAGIRVTAEFIVQTAVAALETVSWRSTRRSCPPCCSAVLDGLDVGPGGVGLGTESGAALSGAIVAIANVAASAVANRPEKSFFILVP